MVEFWEISVTHVVGDGETTSLWHHNWGMGLLKTKLPTLYTYAKDTSVTIKQALQSHSLQQLFRPTLSAQAQGEQRKMQQHLLQLNIDSSKKDDITWRWSKSGSFSVQTAYQTLKDSPRIKTHIHRIWKLLAPPRIKIFGCLMIMNRLLTVDNLIRRGWIIVNRCNLCREAAEPVNHLFNDCRYTAALYQQLNGLPDLSRTKPTHTLLSKGVANEEKGKLLISMFILPRERCTRIFRDEEKQGIQLADEIAQQWQHNQ